MFVNFDEFRMLAEIDALIALPGSALIERDVRKTANAQRMRPLKKLAIDGAVRDETDFGLRQRRPVARGKADRVSFRITQPRWRGFASVSAGQHRRARLPLSACLPEAEGNGKKHQRQQKESVSGMLAQD